MRLQIVQPYNCIGKEEEEAGSASGIRNTFIFIIIKHHGHLGCGEVFILISGAMLEVHQCLTRNFVFKS